MDLETENALSQVIIGSAIEVHRELSGPGLLESVYEEAIVYELKTRGLQVGRQVEVSLSYKSQRLSAPLRLDLLVNRNNESALPVANPDLPTFNEFEARPLDQFWSAKTRRWTSSRHQ